MSLSERLGSLTRDTRGFGRGQDPNEQISPPRVPDAQIESTDPQGGQLIQRCVIIQRDEKGYGLTVSGDNPVFVQSVKDHGAAFKAGVQQGDRIIKVNGTLVTNSNHIEVVKLIKSGSYVALTLLGRPPGHTNRPASGSDPPPPLPVRNTSSDRVHVTGPQPVDPSKEKEFANKKMTTLRMMYEQAQLEYQRACDLNTRSPSEKTMNQILEAENTIKTLDKQIKALSGTGNQTNQNDGSEISDMSEEPPPPYATLDDGPATFDTHSYPAGKKNPAPWLPGGPKHVKYRSDPNTFFHEYPPMRDKNIERSKSDASTRPRPLSTHDSFPQMPKHLKMEPDKPWDLDLRRRVMKKSVSLPISGEEEHASDKESVGESPPLSPTAMHVSNTWPDNLNTDAVSDTDTMSQGTSPEELKFGSPGSSPPTERSIHTATTKHQQANIMCIEEDDFTSEDEHVEDKNAFNILSTLESRPHLLKTVDDRGPFSDLNLLKNKPAHLAVFMHYLISNNDPSPLFFWLVTDSYQQQTGNAKEMRKWAYEIHSTFLVNNAPLKVMVEDSIVKGIDAILEKAHDKEEQLRNIFNRARDTAQNDVRELLADFRRTGDLGLGSLYGAHELQDENMEKSKELKIVEKYLVPHLERFLEDKVVDRSQAMASALTTFLRSSGITKAGANNNILERCPSFVTKEKRFSGFVGGLKKTSKKVKTRAKVYTIKGHSFVAQHYNQTTFCLMCNNIIWGIGNQGFQCKDCKYDVHKQCLEIIEDPCSGKSDRDYKKREKREKRVSMFSGGGDRRNTTTVSQSRLPKDEDQDVAPSPGHATGSKSSFWIQPGKQEPEPELADAQEGKYVKKVIQKFQEIQDKNEDSSPTGGSPRSRTPEKEGEEKPTTGISKSGSFRERKFSNQRRRQTKSDVDKDEGALQTALSRSEASSSNSSLSQKSADSPRNSSEAISESASTVSSYDSDLEVEAEMPSLDKYIPKDAYKKMKPKERKRQEVVNELLYTERAHVRNLKVMENIFHTPMLRETNIPFDFTRLLFPNLPEVIKLHCSLNEKLKSRRREAVNGVVGNVGDIILSCFKDEEGENFRAGMARFCANQSLALETLKSKRRKDTKIAMFLSEAESHPLCRRLELKDFLPMVFQRLTKYPLLLESLLKYTSMNTEEYENLQKSLECSKNILAYVNKAVEQTENHQKLVDIQRRMDRKGIDNSSNPLVADYKNLDLTKYVLIHEGHLRWRINREKQIDLHVVLLEDFLVLLQKQDEKLVLKCHSMVVGRDDTKFTHSPIIKLTNLLTRNVATDKKAFFLVSTSSVGPQIYELVAMAAEEKKRWFKYITEAADAHKKREGDQPRGGRRGGRVVTGTSQEPRIPIPTERIEEEEKEKTLETNLNRVQSQSVESLDNLDKEKGEMVQISDAPELVQPAEVVVTEKVMERADSVVLTPFESLKKQDNIIQQALLDKQRITAEILNVPADDFENVAELVCIEEGDKDARELVLASILQTNRLTSMISHTLNVEKNAPPEAATVHGDLENKQLLLSLPSNKLHAISKTLQDALRQLLAIVSQPDEEKEKLKEKVKEMESLQAEIQNINQKMMLIASLPQAPVSPNQTSPFEPSPNNSLSNDQNSRPNSYMSVGSSTSGAEDMSEAERTPVAVNNEDTAFPVPPIKTDSQSDANKQDAMDHSDNQESRSIENETKVLSNNIDGTIEPEINGEVLIPELKVEQTDNTSEKEEFVDTVENVENEEEEEDSSETEQDDDSGTETEETEKKVEDEKIDEGKDDIHSDEKEEDKDDDDRDDSDEGSDEEKEEEDKDEESDSSSSSSSDEDDMVDAPTIPDNSDNVQEENTENKKDEIVDEEDTSDVVAAVF